MWNSSEFMRTYKQHFTMSFNARRDHHGTMFEGRYHERNHKPENPVMWRTAAYVDINACEAGIVKRPEDYEWCSFAAAVKGDEKARRGYAFIYGNGDWETIRACHEKSMREAMGASQGRRHSQQHPFQSLLPFPVAGEGHHCSNRSRSSAVAPAEVLPDMSYYISDTMSISSDPCAPVADRPECDPYQTVSCHNISSPHL